MLDDAFQAGTDAVIRDALQRPMAPRVQAPKFSLWGTLGAAAGGVPRGVAEMGASAIDLMSGLSKVDVSAETMAASMTPEGRAEMQRKAKETLETGFRDNEVARSLRAASDYYMPDPITAHGAEIVASDFLRVATKAIGSAVALGPIPGAILAGAEEGFTQSDRLAQQGVDVATRSQVGLVTGAVTAAGFALPVAGRTWAQTAGLAVAGGPASFIGQNAISRAILENADYTKQAQQFDPFDPVGLTLSTLLPFGFGALAMRGAKARVPVEAEDAARVTLLRESVDAHRTVPAMDLQGSVMHEQAMVKAMDQLAAGERVDVSDVVPMTDVPEVMRPMLEGLEAARAEAEALPQTEVQTSAPRVMVEGEMTRPGQPEGQTAAPASAQPADVQTVGNPRDLVAETVSLRKQQSVLTKLVECLNG